MERARRTVVLTEFKDATRLVIQRLTEFLIVGLWLVSTAWLIARDAVPRWFAQPPPPPASVSWLEEQGRRFQYGIYAENGAHKGTCWSVYKVGKQAILRKDTMLLKRLQFIEDLILDAELTFLNESELDNIDIEIRGMRATIRLRGERQGSQFAFTLKIGTLPLQEFMLDAVAAQTLCDIVKPFTFLRGLQVGQSWKIHVIDPFSLVNQGQRARLKPMLVRVVGQETIKIQGRQVSCYVVESPGTRAWVDEQGRVLLQSVEVPGLGKLEIREQSFQQRQYEDALRELMGYRGDVRSNRSS